MKNVLLLLIHLLTAVAKLLGPGGIKGILAENLLLKQHVHGELKFTQPAGAVLNLDNTFSSGNPLGQLVYSRHVCLPPLVCSRRVKRERDGHCNIAETVPAFVPSPSSSRIRHVQGALYELSQLTCPWRCRS